MTAAALLAPWLVLGLLLWPHSRQLGARLTAWAPLPALLLALLPGVDDRISLGLLDFGADALGRDFLLFVALIWWLAGLFAASWMRDRAERLPFAAFWLTTLAGSLGLLLAQNLVSLYVCFAIASLAAWGLVLAGEDPRRTRPAARVYLTLMALAEVALLTGIAAAATVDGMAFGSLAVEGAGGLALAAFAFGFAIKLGVLGVHFWLPPAHAAAPLPASAVLSAVLVKAGLFGWLRIVPPEPTALDGLSLAVIVLGFVAVFYGAVSGITRDHPKQVLAFSTVSQMGLLLVAVGLGTLADQTLALLAGHHALAKATAFLGLGLLASASGQPRTCILMGLFATALVLIGVPFTSGAVAKTVLESALHAGDEAPIFTLALALSATATTLLMLRFGILALGHTSTRTLIAGLWLPWGLLVVAMLLSPWWLPGAPGTASVSLGQIWPLLLGLMIGLPAMRIASALPHPGRVVGRLDALVPPLRPSRVVHLERRLLRWANVGALLLLLALGMLALVFFEI